MVVKELEAYITTERAHLLCLSAAAHFSPADTDSKSQPFKISLVPISHQIESTLSL